LEGFRLTENDKVFKLTDLNWEINLDSYNQSICSNEKLLLILNKNSGLAPYSHEFIEGAQDPQVLSGFISAISSFIGEATGKDQSQWKTVFGTDSIIIVESGEWSIGVLAAGKETSEARSKLRSIVREFEDCFEYLRDVEGIENQFSDFDQYVRRMFVDERISGRTRVTKNPEWRELMNNFDLPSTAFEVSKILHGFNESTTMEEIMELHDKQFDRIVEVVSTAFWHRIVSLVYIPSDDDILSLSDRASTILFDKSNPLRLQTRTLSILSQLDGRRSLSSYTSEIPNSEKEELLDDLGGLINNGLVQRISVEKKLVLFNEFLLSELVSKGTSIVGRRTMERDFETIREMGRVDHPWLGRINLIDGMQVRCLLEHSMTPIDLDDMYGALDYFIDEITNHLSKRCGKRVTDRLFRKTEAKCREIWAPYLANVVI
jgi:hypothetical protein